MEILMVRNPINDLEAVAAMPGLYELAEVLREADPGSARLRTDHASLVTLLTSRWAFGSLQLGAACLRDGGVWARMRHAANQVGRTLPAQPPTEDQLQAMRNRIASIGDDALGDTAQQLMLQFTEVAVPLVQQAGLLVPSEPRWHALSRTNVLYGDGSPFGTLTDVEVDTEGTIKGSRAKHQAGDGPGNRGPRVAVSYADKDGIAALPIATIGVHGGQPLQRGMVAIRMFTDGDEAGASLDAIRQVIDLAGAGVHGVTYDMLLSSFDLHQLMRWGVMPFVRMKQPQQTWSHLVLPEELRERTYNTGRKKEQRQGKGKTKQHKPKAPFRKVRVRNQTLGQIVTGERNGKPCEHEIWAIDGMLVATELGRKATLDSPALRQVNLSRVQHQDGTYGFQGMYEIPCRGHHELVEFDHTDYRKGTSKGRRNVMVEWVRPYPEADPRTRDFFGWRQDAESTFSTLKRRMHLDGRAGSLDPHNFLIDVVAGGMFINAVLWDEYVVRLTNAARR